MTERERLRTALDGYAADDIRAMLEGHSPGAGAVRRKSERIDQLTRLLVDPAFARRAVSALSPLGRRALGIVRRAGRTSLAALFLAASADAGEAEARRELERLLRAGLLLVEERDSGHKASLDLADQASRLRWVTAPQAILDALPADAAEAGLLPPLAGEPSRVEAGSFAELRRDLYLALRFLKSSGLRLTRTGEPHRTDLRKLFAALQPGQAPPPRGAGAAQLDGRLLFELRLLLATGLAREDQGLLRTDEQADEFLNASETTAARRLYDTWLTLDWDEFARLSHLTTEPWTYGGATDHPTPDQLAAARAAIGALLPRLARPGAGAQRPWVGVGALAGALRRTDPEFLIPRLSETPPGYHGYYGYYGGYYQSWQSQEQGFYRGLVRADSRGRERRLHKERDWGEVEGAYVAQVCGEPLVWLGLVDAGYESGAERPVAVRLTDLGARLFAPAAATDEPVAAGTTLVVQPNFEVLVLDALAHLDLLASLDAFAEARGLDRAAVYTLTRPAFVRGLAAGWTEERIVAMLEGGAGAPLPQNVRHTLGDWAREYERVHLRRAAALLETPDAATLDRLLARPAVAGYVDRRLAPTVALLRADVPAALADAIEAAGAMAQVVDYAVDEPQILDLNGPGEIVVSRWDDEPYLDYRLARFADRGAPADGRSAGATYRVDQQSLARARENGVTIDEILSFLGYKARVGLSPDDIVTLRGWAGYYTPFRYAGVRAVELPPTVNWGDLNRVKALRPLILRILSASLALIREDHWPEFEAALTARGIALKPGLGAPAAGAKRAGAQRAAERAGMTTGRDLVAGKSRQHLARRDVPLLRLSGRTLTDFIEEALDAEQTLVIEYRKPNERRSTRRVIEPRELEVRGGSYYLHAFCHLRQEERDFRLSNIVGVAVAEE
ncbi:MAG TPA: helicase-associated domain-containing protein [Thermomicrobiales bacterium]|nr:helicase-associated domain-containing protein [Thermomicrobiales bacterium]